MEENSSKALTPSETSRDVQQYYDCKALLRRRTQPNDPYENVHILMAAEGDDKFIRKVTNTPDCHSICLFSDDMINFILKHCGAGGAKTPIHVDTTFDLTNSFVVICTLRAVGCEGSPLIVGPALVTKRQTASDVMILWQSLPAKLRELPLVFVTDGDRALIKSIVDSFPNARLFRCRLHLLGNVQGKLRELFMESVSKSILRGMKLQMSFTLVEFDTSSAKLYQNWKADIIRCKLQDKCKDFLEYYRRQVEPVIRNNVAELAVAAGVGYTLFDNNPSESANAIVKGWCDNKKQPVDELCRRMKIGCNGQLKDWKRGLYGMSRKYIPKDFSSIEVSQRPLHKKIRLRLVTLLAILKPFMYK